MTLIEKKLLAKKFAAIGKKNEKSKSVHSSLTPGLSRNLGQPRWTPYSFNRNGEFENGTGFHCKKEIVSSRLLGKIEPQLVTRGAKGEKKCQEEPNTNCKGVQKEKRSALPVHVSILVGKKGGSLRPG